MASLRLITWNLDGLHDADLDRRTEAACLRMLLRDPPGVVGLQEVVRRSWHGHIKHHFAAAGYVPVPDDPTVASSEYFCVVFVHRSLTLRAWGNDRFAGTSMGRHLVWAEIVPGGTDTAVWFATSHLESGRGAARERIRQLSAVVARLDGAGGPAVFAGDTNLRQAEEGDVDGLDGVVDAWVAVGSPSDRRGTWPSVPSRRGPRAPPARFDRVLTRGVQIDSFELIGHSSPTLDGHTPPGPPSDHLGIEVVVTVE